ncbi:acyl-CoA dehydrogenase family protein [Streptomyces sp. NPDC051987]|uniref:acyl-CoA dehydrogenase family protein n=1 Tax=Streptomyces sp. NPDC051987 TaxID=3155808 RepID=UPI00342ECB90
MTIPPNGPAAEPTVERAARVARTAAGPAAEQVDRDARLPVEALTALREARPLFAMVPSELGGESAGLAEVGRAVEALATSCGSTALIFATHQVQVACLLRHARDSTALRAFLAEAAEGQLLIASATSETGAGGDARTSRCFLESADGRFRVDKQVPTMSYGAHADAALVSAARSADSSPHDQVLVLCRRPELELEQTGTWDTLGFRGTCGPPRRLRAGGPLTHVLQDPFADILSHTMLPVSHVLWGSVWLGLATRALNTAKRFLRESARRSPGVLPAESRALVEVAGAHQRLTVLVHDAASRCDEASGDELARPGTVVAMNNLKISASRLAVDVVAGALAVTGLAGYRNDGRHALGRLLRDVYGGLVMVGNERIAANAARLLLATGDV